MRALFISNYQFSNFFQSSGHVTTPFLSRGLLVTVCIFCLIISSFGSDSGHVTGQGHVGGGVSDQDVLESVKVATTTPKHEAMSTTTISSTTTTTTTSDTTSTPTSSTTRTSTPSKATKFTMGPSTNINYEMILDSSGPAVLDSAMWFSVNLKPQGINASASNWTIKYIYQWMNMANKAMNRTVDGLASRINMTFVSKKIKAGNYPMTVAAFLKDDPTKLVAFQTQIFVLTEKLNGQLVLEQDLVYQRFDNVFATNRKVSLRAKVHDHFHRSMKPSFTYLWYKGDTLLKTTTNPSIDTKVIIPTNTTVKSKVFLSFFQPGPASGVSPLQSNGPGSSAKDYSPRGLFHHPNQGDGFSAHLPLKTGNFNSSAIFKDEVTDCVVQRVDTQGLSIKLDSSAKVKVTCWGSPPFAVCVNISKQNESVDPRHACLPQDFVDQDTQTIDVFLNKTGWQDVHFFVYNDVGRIVNVKSFYGYSRDSHNILPLTLPIVFGVIGAVVILFGSVYIMRLRKKPLVEVADFDFHPVLTSRLRDSNSITLSRMFNSLRYFLSRDKASREEGDIITAEFSPTPTELSPTPTDFSHTPALTESYKSETEHALYGSL